MDDPQTVVLTNLDWDGDFQTGELFNLEYQVTYTGASRPLLLVAVIDGQDVCEGGEGSVSC